MPTYRLTKRIEIRRRARASSDFETVEDEGKPVATAWAFVVPINSSERVEVSQVYPTATHRAVIRWPTQRIDSACHLIINDERFDVDGVLDVDGNGQYLELILTRRDSGSGDVTTR